jgi:hypothetical protein
MPETWSILIIALDVVVIYALIVHGREMADRRRSGEEVRCASRTKL